MSQIEEVYQGTALKIILEPRVTLISRPQFIEPAHLPCEWEGEASDGERLVEYSGRICYLSHHNPAKRTTEAYLNNILGQGHGSILEHANYSFLIEGISRTCSHELVRHRAGCAYSQLSQRYVDSSEVAFVLPPALFGNGEAISEWKGVCTICLESYKNLVEVNLERFKGIVDPITRRKVARESARSVLPNCTETKLVMTANLRAWRTILELRCGEGAEKEIRRLAINLLAQLTAECPYVFPDWVTFKLSEDDYSLAATPGYHKV